MTELSDVVSGLLEVARSDVLHQRGVIDSDEIEGFKFKDKTVMRFETLQDAVNFTKGFAAKYLLPRYGPDAAGFPMTKVTTRVIGSVKEGAEVFGQFAGLLPQDLNQEVWLLVQDDRYAEVETYIASIKTNGCP